MLRHLHIEHYALIDRLELELHPGLNLLTGETGSGKSIVVDAVDLLLGEKASPDLVRSGAERARIVGIFAPESATATGASANGRKQSKPKGASTPAWPRILTLLEESGIEAAEDELIVQRDILAAGRSRIFVNSQPATAGLLRSLAPLLAEVHGQNEQQSLFEPATQRDVLDRFAGQTALITKVGDSFEQGTTLRRRAEELRVRNREWLRQRDLWEFQKREIEEAAVSEGEDERLEEEKRVLANAERIQMRLSSSYDLLYDSPGSAASALASAQRQIDEVAAFDASLQPLTESLLSAKVAVEDLALAVRDRLSRLDATPGRLEEVENRLALLDKLKRKYGPSVADVLRHFEQVSSQLQQAESGEANLQAFTEEVSSAAREYLTAARELSAKRAKAALELKRAVEKELQSLAMAGTVFEARLTSSAEEQDWGRTGIDSVEFLISPNPGEPLRPLARIASGGETSRIMLALETVSAASAATGSDHTLVFDEVDAGIGGRAAEAVGRKLRLLGERRQVLCVTHLPQIASFAHHHFRVEKRKQAGRTVTEVQYLDDRERKAELARMLSGSQITSEVLAHAEQLLKANAG